MDNFEVYGLNPNDVLEVNWPAHVYLESLKEDFYNETDYIFEEIAGLGIEMPTTLLSAISRLTEANNKFDDFMRRCVMTQ